MAGITPNSIYINKDLYSKRTDDVVYKILDGLSLTSVFAVNIIDNDEVSLLAYEAVLPGTSFQTTEVFGDRQGIKETFANQRIYPPIDVSFYIKKNYSTINYFENWFKTACPILGNGNAQQDSFFKFNYPNTYKKSINIVKYERDFRTSSHRLDKDGPIKDPKSITYTLLNAYPTNIISIPISYEQSAVLRTTITFNYDRYFFQNHEEVLPPEPTFTTSSIEVA